MLVRLHDQFLRASPNRQLEHSMAPFSATFDYRSQIIDNCEFFVAKYDIVSVITAKDAVGDFKAYAIRSNEDTRTALLSSDPCGSALKAIESLHTKSCEAANHYITTNGFSYPPDLKKTRLDEDEKDDEDDDEDAASVVSGHSASSTVALSCWGSSDDEATMTPASSADPHAGYRETSSSMEKGNNNISKRRSKPRILAGRQARDSCERFPADEPDDDSDDEHHHPQQHLPPRVRLVSPIRSSSVGTTSYRPPPPPPGWIGPPMLRGVPLSTPQSQSQSQSQPGPHYCQQPSPPGQPIPAVSRGIPSTHAAASMSSPTKRAGAVAALAAGQEFPVGPPMRAHPASALHYKASAPNLVVNHSNNNGGSAPSPPHPTNLNHHPMAAQRLYDVRLTIRWLGHGEQRILESSRASIRALQEMAVAYVRSHASAFDGNGNGNVNGSNSNRNSSGGWGLRACVRRAFFGPGEAYDMSAYRGDDLTKLFNVLSAGSIPRFEVEVEGVAAVQR
ncbi:hypothetical protein F4677DRAFT_391386 [Hypoxylon crocopeplum]|nr:hypothetical protein F4677DRAFT_391386 [Hypoxylon crocopeplum]